MEKENKSNVEINKLREELEKMSDEELKLLALELAEKLKRKK